MRSPCISAIIPCYCAANTLTTAVQSVLGQTNSDFEIIIVDDGSLDASAKVAACHAASDSRIRLIQQENSGPAAARNRGIQEARSPVIAFLDADDRWTPDFVERHLAHFIAVPRCGVSFSRVQFFDPEMTQPGRVSSTLAQVRLEQVLGENPVCTTSNIVARRRVLELVGGFNTGLTHGEDQEWVARVLATTGWQVHGLPQILVHYRTSPAGLSADLAKTESGWRAMIECVRAYAPEVVARAEPDASALFHRFLARRALRTGQSKLAILPMMRAWQASPLTLLTRQPSRTLMTMAGALAALMPGNPAAALLAR
jgi:glycosyltransferase involved in cell wall biosynthesis